MGEYGADTVSLCEGERMGERATMEVVALLFVESL